ncbi:FliM/FliN family flagellar motor switch protein [Bremerella sp. JC770]|uniref:FliM/FliN family flagellar motor switch protein n=1 Tax=Bremerella sp. JC770 TaxID=3232137 RepID=UPI003457EAE9
MAPLLLESRTSSHIRFMNSTLGVRRLFDFKVCDASFQLRFVDGIPVDDCAISIEVRGSKSGRIVVKLSDTSAIESVIPEIEDFQATGIPEEVSAILLDHLLGPALAELGRNAEEEFAIVTVGQSQCDADLPVALVFNLSVPTGEVSRGSLHFEQQWVQTIETLVSTTPAIRTDGILDLRISAPVHIGRTHISIAELDRIEPHDVILLDETESGQQVAEASLGASMLLRGTLQDSLLIDSILCGYVDTTTGKSVAPTNLGKLSLPVSVSIGTVQQTLDNWYGVKVGDQLPIRNYDQAFAHIYVAGHFFATGTLIRSRHRLAVQVVRRSPEQRCQSLLHSFSSTPNQSAASN